MLGKGGKAISFGISLGVILIYYTLLIISLNLSGKEYLPPGIIMWLSNFVITTIGIYLFKKMVKR
jgi:lipopolysaccharide export LptBFGC system permease protein LptF